MRMYDLIYKKRQGLALSDEEIRFIVRGYTDGIIPDYQMSALTMAILFRSMDDREIATLTDAMANSGETVDLSEFGTLSVDKHSTGGVGDKTTLIVAPIVASCGAKLAKMTGRGLGHTGGTADKLESLPGYRTELTQEEFLAQTRSIGIAVIGQSRELAPADKKLYALRDVTATVDSIPLIVSSIMSKKLAAGARNIVLDVKAGSGAFMQTTEDAIELAEKMVAIGRRCGRNMGALVTNMDLPLGFAIGNALEMQEALSVLHGEKAADDLREICLALSATLLSLCLKLPYEQAMEKAENALDSGAALAKFREWVVAQGADGRFVDHPGLFPKAAVQQTLKSTQTGWITRMHTAEIGIASCVLGAGRIRQEDRIDPEAGIILHKKTGDFIRKGEPLATLYTMRSETLADAEARFRSALTFSSEKPEPPRRILKRI